MNDRQEGIEGEQVTYMMAVDAVLHVAVLARGARVEPSEIGYGYYLLR
jgi:hypothetical protein